MNINRNNYENFFLLYADGELRADEGAAVEEFVEANKDLKIELEMILAAVLPVEEFLFIDKNFLYKAPTFDTVLQSKLLLQIDNELAPIELELVNKTVASNSAAKKELELLQRTKLDIQEKIVFAEKHLLYKKERDNVIAFGWLRWASAAMLIGFGLFIGIKIVSNKQTGNSTNVVVSVNKPVENKNAMIANDSLKNIIENVVTTNVTTTNTSNNNSSNANRIIEELNTTNNTVASQKNIVSKKDSRLKTNAASKTTYDPKNEKQTLLVINQNKYLPDGTQLPLEKTIPIKNEPILIAATNQLIDTKQPIIKDENIVPLETNYTQAMAVATAEKNENKILYMDEDAVKHTKVGGFFRKVKRFVERTANIKTGNTLQIAGFEIAAL